LLRKQRRDVQFLKDQECEEFFYMATFGTLILCFSMIVLGNYCHNLVVATIDEQLEAKNMISLFHHIFYVFVS